LFYVIFTEYIVYIVSFLVWDDVEPTYTYLIYILNILETISVES